MNRFLFMLTLASLAATVPAEPLPRGAYSRADELRLRRADAAVVQHLESERFRLETERLRLESAQMRIEDEKLERARHEQKSRHRLPLLGE